MRAALALALLLATPAAAQPADPVAALRDALASVGCLMTQANQNEVLDASGLVDTAAIEALGVLIGAGEAVVEGSEVRLVSGTCTGVGGPAPDAAVLADRRARAAAALAARGCRVGEADIDPLAADLGLSQTEATGVLLDLVGRGEARAERVGNRDVVILTAPPCDTPLAQSLPLRVLQVVQQNGCAMSEDEADALLAPLGPQADVRAAVAPMFEGNAAALGGPGGAFFLLNEALCTADLATAEGLLAELDAVIDLRPEQRPPFRAAPLAATVMVARVLRAEGCVQPRDAVERLVFATHLPNPPSVLAGWLAAGFLTDQGDRIALGADWCALPDADLPAALAAMVPAGQPTK